MCGIAGIIDLSGAEVPAEDIERLVSYQATRGPDAGASIRSPGSAFGHRRLAILDLAGGAQPMRSPDGRFTLVYNGEIYNAPELRTRLEGLGCTFRGHGDTEVLFEACRTWGRDAPARLRGMFAFAWHDAQEGTLLLARDHLGIKPLVWCRSGSRFAFASELQALRRLPWFDRSIDRAAVRTMLRLQYIPSPATAYVGARRLPPGHAIVVDDHGIGKPWRYWSADWSVQQDDDADTWRERLQEVIEESVRVHLIADRPVGGFLSGGMDSATVMAIAARHGVPKACTVGLADGDDEVAMAAAMAARLGLEHRFERIGPDSLGMLDALVARAGEPFGDPSIVPTWHVCKLAVAQAPVALSGDGGDELFGGYATYASWLRWLDRSAGRTPRALVRSMASRIMPSRWPPARPGAAAWFHQVAWMGPGELEALMPGEPDPGDPLQQVPGGAGDPLTMAQAMDLETYLPDCILHKVDLASMSHGLEVRTPLVDVRVVELACRIPANVRSRRGGVHAGKALFREVASHVCGADPWSGPKRGFSLPLERWLVGDSARLRDVHGRLCAAGSPLHDLLDAEGVARIVRTGHAGRIWLLLVVDSWMRGMRL